MRLQSLSALAALASMVMASPRGLGSRGVDARDGVAASPCAIVSSSVAAALAVSPSATPVVDAQLAFDCLNSVPLHAAEALALVDSMLPYIEWQSDLAYLKNPPKPYEFPAVDVFGGFAKIKANIQAGVYVSEYQFQADIYKIFGPCHDGHFIFYPDLFTKAFEWGRPISLVSISKTGHDIPKIYITSDILLELSSKKDFDPSEVTKIDGEDAAEYVENFSRLAAPLQDPDSAYNVMFFEKAFTAEKVGRGLGLFSGGGRYRYVYPGANTTITFANGTITTYQNIAFAKGDFKGVTDGESAYQKFCAVPGSTPLPPMSSSTSIASSTVQPTVTKRAPPSAAQTAPGYPAPVIISSDNVVSGYYLKDYPEVAVLAMLSFEPQDPAEFQAVVQNFLAKAKADGKKKMVIDLSANGGGYILQGYDTYRQFFPQIEQDGFSRIRENAGLLTMASLFSNAIPANYSPATAPDAVIQEYEIFLNYRYDLNVSDKHFSSFEDKFAPHIYRGDPYTSVLRWDFNDPLTTINSTYGIGFEMTGYGSRQNFTQPFAAEDIIMLYDGFCSSTCTLFSEFMRQQGHVKSIAMGGRPTRQQIQGVGGVKGAQSVSWAFIASIAQAALPLTSSTSEIAILNNYTALPLLRSTANGVNLRDAILRDNLEDGVPGQFIVEPADCRLYWTKEMVGDVGRVWEAAAAAAWGEKACVAGRLPENESKRGLGAVQDADIVDHSYQMKAVEKRTPAVQRDSMWEARHGVKGPL